MSLAKIAWDEWRDMLCNEHEITSPTWADVEQVVRLLDEDHHTIVRLISDEGYELLIGGGKGRFIITAIRGEDAHVTARRDSQRFLEVELNVGGQTGIYPAQMIWDENTTMRTARCYWETNQLDPALSWSEP